MKALAPLNNKQLKTVSTEELKRHLASSLEVTARHLQYMAGIWRELEERGEDLSSLRHGIAAYLPLIAHDRVDASIVIKYAGQKTLLSALASLPIGEQRQIAETGYVLVARTTDSDKAETVEVPLSRLAAAEVFQVFSDDGLRSPEDQIRFIERRNIRAPTTRYVRKARRVKIDKEAGVLLVSNSAADIDRVVDQLSEFYGVDLAQLILEAQGEQ